RNTAASTMSSFRGITVGSNGGTIDVPTAQLTWSTAGGGITGGDAALITKTGTALFFNSGNNPSYSGKWAITAGTLNPSNTPTADLGWGIVPTQFVADSITLNGGTAPTNTNRIGIREGAGSVGAVYASNRGMVITGSGGSIENADAVANSFTIAGAIS